MHSNNNFNAIGWHAEKIISRLSRGNRLVVLAEKTSSKASMSKFNKNTTILRTWKKGNPLSILMLSRHLLSLQKVKRIYVPFEFNIFGGTLPNIALVGLLIILRVMGKQITFEFHQVIFDIGDLKKHIFIRNAFQKYFYNFGLKVFYTLIGILSESVIVFELELKERLSKFVNRNKISVLSLSTSVSSSLSKKAAREKLKISHNDFIVLVFGYINGYKGIPWIMEKLSSPVKLIIAGGKNPYLKHLQHYKNFYASIVNAARKLPHVTHTGFIPDTKVETYYKAADLVVIPYEVFMSASGPFSLALSYKKPVLLADTLIDYSKSKDFACAMTRAGIKSKDLFFSHQNNELPQLIRKYRTNKLYRVKLHTFVELLSNERSEEKVVEKLNSLLAFTPASKRATINILPRFLLLRS